MSYRFALIVSLILVNPALHAQQSAVAEPGVAESSTTNREAPVLTISDEIPVTSYPEVDYKQALRPQFHFSSKKNWLNDPNGMIFDGKQYHLFFQHNPLSTEWGNMTWGHAVSKDMIHWTQLDHALLPYQVGDRKGTIFSGTAIIDHNNALGKQVGDQKTICAFFTFASEPKFYQAMAYSTDGGMTFEYWNNGLPVVENQGFDSGERDPKVFWHEPSQQWVMVLWVQQNPGRVRWFTSKNLVDWKFASDLMRDWAFECMDVVFLPVDGDAKNQKCLIYDASFDYEIGTFDGTTFHSETKPHINVRGNFYAAQTFNNMPDDRCVQIGWMRAYHNVAAQFGLPYNQQMAFPSELTLKTTENGIRLFCYPIREIEKLVENETVKDDFVLSSGQNAIDDLDLRLVDLDITFEPKNSASLKFDLPNVSLEYDSSTGTLRHHGINDKGEPQWMTTLEGVFPVNGVVSLRLLIDRMTVEAFANQGEQFAAFYLHPDNNPKKYSLTSSAELEIKQLRVRQLKSAW